MATRALGVSTKIIKELRAEGGILHGKKCLGVGQFSMVYDNGDETVTKVTADPASYALVNCHMHGTNGNPLYRHLPYYLEDLGDVGEITLFKEGGNKEEHSVWAYTATKLTKVGNLPDLLPSQAVLFRAYKNIVKTARAETLNQNYGNMHHSVFCIDVAQSAARLTDEYFAKGILDEEQHEELKLLFDLAVNYEAALDAAAKPNMMLRKDGSLVINDPVFDMSLQRSLQQTRFVL